MRRLLATRCRRRPDRRRLAYSLAELLVSMVSSTVLMGGLAGTLYIASHAINTDQNGNRHARISGEIVGDLVADLRHARSFTERTATAVTFTVPDRTGDGIDETLRYAWSGTAGDPLTYEINGGPVTTLAANVQHFQLTALERLMLGAPISETPEENGGVVFHAEDYQEAIPPLKKSTSGNTLVIPAPATINDGDLLIAVVARDVGGGDLSPPNGDWQQIDRGDGNYLSDTMDISLGVWYKIASSSESGTNYSFNLTQAKKAYGWIMRFSGHAVENWKNATATATGNASIATSPSVITDVDNCLILRIVACDDGNITPGVTGLSEPPHVTITMDESDTGINSVSGGAGYAQQATAGDTGTDSFALGFSLQPYRAVTIAIAPAE